MDKNGQQEIVGFVLIVVLVMVGLMVFLVISLRDGSESGESLEVRNMLDAMMKYTTDCAIVYEPDYDDVEDLFKSCYKEDDCINLGLSACDYLNESLHSLLIALMASEASVGAYELSFFVRGEAGLLQIREGNCTGDVNAAQRSIVSGSDSLVVRLKTCAGG